MISSYRSNCLGLSLWDPYTVRRGGCLELYYCNMVDWFWWNSSLIWTTNWFPSVLWHCWFGHLACKNRPRNDLLCVELDVKPYTLTHTHVYPVSFGRYRPFKFSLSREVVEKCGFESRFVLCRGRICSKFRTYIFMWSVLIQFRSASSDGSWLKKKIGLDRRIAVLKT